MARDAREADRRSHIRIRDRVLLHVRPIEKEEYQKIITAYQNGTASPWIGGSPPALATLFRTSRSLGPSVPPANWHPRSPAARFTIRSVTSFVLGNRGVPPKDLGQRGDCGAYSPSESCATGLLMGRIYLGMHRRTMVAGGRRGKRVIY